jgi:hypothetical protein
MTGDDLRHLVTEPLDPDQFEIAEFLNNLEVRAYRRKEWQLIAELSYVTHIRGYPQIITAEIDYITDLSSIPWWARWAIPVNDYHRWAGVLHDWLFDNQDMHDFSRLEVDCIFQEAMEIFEELEQWKIAAMYNAVRIGAGSNWVNNVSHSGR